MEAKITCDITFVGGNVASPTKAIRRENGIARLPLDTRIRLRDKFVDGRLKKAEQEVWTVIKNNQVTLDEFTLLILDNLVGRFYNFKKSEAQELKTENEQLKAQLAALLTSQAAPDAANAQLKAQLAALLAQAVPDADDAQVAEVPQPAAAAGPVQTNKKQKGNKQKAQDPTTEEQ
jgi:hypothetical protein